MQIFVHFLYILRPLEENNLQIKIYATMQKKPK